MPTNKGAVITGCRNLEKLVEVKEIPYPQLEPDMVILKTIASAVNPTDWKHIYPESFTSFILGTMFSKLGFGFRSLERPLYITGNTLGHYIGTFATRFQKGKVVGSDVCGVVVEVGDKVTRVKKGDIITVSLHGGISNNGGYSTYVKVSPNSAIVFPKLIEKPALAPGEYPGSNIDTCEAAVSVGLGLKTVAIAFNHELKIPADKSKNSDKYILIWGGATATGNLAIQIAKLVYGLKVITTASTKNHKEVLELGADLAFDYKDKNVINDIIKAGEGKINYALDCVSSPETLQSVYNATEGTDEVKINNLLYLTEKAIIPKPGRKVEITATDGYVTDGRVHFGKKALDEFFVDFFDFWDNLLPPVLGKIQTTPLHVLKPGLQSANQGLVMLMQNQISRGKIVFRNTEL